MRRLTFILFLFPMLLHGAPDSQSLDEILCNLDAHIEKREDYVQEKQRRITALQDELKKGAPEREYDLNYGLFEEYFFSNFIVGKGTFEVALYIYIVVLLTF